MAECVIRRAAAADRPALQTLWEAVFGDPTEWIQAFFTHFPPETSGWVVGRGTEICSAAYLLTGNRLICGGQSRPCAYVYAVATPKAQRGHGYASLLMRHFAQMAGEDGFALYTLPAEPGLYAWYRAVMDASEIGTGCEITIQRGLQNVAAVPIRSVSPAEYGQLRESCLAAVPHVALSEAFLSLQAEYSALVKLGDGCAAAEIEGGTLQVKELLVPEAQLEDAAQALLRHFDLDAAVVRRQGAHHTSQPLAAFRPLAPAPGSPVNWGLFLD